MKTCSRCGTTKEDSGFRPKRAVCKDCCNEQRRAERANNPVYLAQHREYERKRREENPERNLELSRERYKRDGEKRREAARKARRENPLREKAHAVVRLAVDRGDLPPAWSMVCDVCQEAQAVDWHHHSYEQEHWMDVKAVCAACHGREHRMARASA